MALFLWVLFWLACAAFTFTLWFSGAGFFPGLLLGFVAPTVVMLGLLYLKRTVKG